jgi:hypothetical protein
VRLTLLLQWPDGRCHGRLHVIKCVRWRTQVRCLFDLARAAGPSIIFIDEVWLSPFKPGALPAGLLLYSICASPRTAAATSARLLCVCQAAMFAVRCQPRGPF